MRFLLLIFFLTTTLVSCEKKPYVQPYREFVGLDSSVYTYLYQPEGTRLYFQDSVTGAWDTVHIYQSDIDTFKVTDDNGKPIYEGEEWTQRERHSNTGHDFTFATYVRNPNYYTSNMVHKDGGRNGFGNSVYIFTPMPAFVGYNVSIDWNSSNQITHYYDSISFDSTYYYKAYRVHTINESPMNHTDNVYYYAAGYGLVRWEDLTNQKIWKRIH